jgi:hypothetical protein
MPSEPTGTLLRGGTVVSVDPALGDFRGDVLIEGTSSPPSATWGTSPAPR